MDRFQKPQIKVNSRLKYAQLYEQFPTMIRNGHLLNKIQISSNPSHVNHKNPISIQLATRRTMHCAQGLTLDN